MNQASQGLSGYRAASHAKWHPARPRPGCTVSVLEGADLAQLDPVQWDALSANALEDNPFLSRQYMRAGLESIDDARGLGVLAFRLHQNGRLVGLLPFRRQPFGRYLPLAEARVPLNLYQVGGVPLIDADRADLVVESLLEAMTSTPGVPRRWVLPHVVLDGPFASLAGRHAPDKNIALLSTRSYERPVLARLPGGFQAHVEAIIGKKRAKDIQRNLRRLGELGALRFERALEPVHVALRVEQFLEMEHRGWKGEKGTSFLSNPAHALFARQAFAGTPEASGLASVDTLLLDDRPIAISINIGAGRTLFTPKCAFDETFRKFGPGLALEYLVIEAFYGDTAHDLMDASTTTAGHVISGLWNTSRKMGTLVIGPDGLLTQLLAATEDAEHNARSWLKSVLSRMRQ